MMNPKWTNFIGEGSQSMEIIKKGELPAEKLYTLTCRYCSTEFRFKQGEAKRISDQRDGNYLSINCPLCHRQCTQSL